MSRYIDADAFLEHMKKTPRYFHFLGDIEYFPTADVEPVRRCKDCSNFRNNGRITYCNFFAAAIEKDDFCSYFASKDGRECDDLQS